MPAQTSRGFAEKVAVVSDGGNAFGRAIALQLALQGCYVIVGFADSSAENERALAGLQEIGTLAGAVRADIATTAGVTELFSQVENMYGRLDLLVNTAQLEVTADFLATDALVFAEMIDRNLKSSFFCSQAAVRLMLNRPNAAIVNLIGENHPNSLFAATQAALVGLTKSLALELAPKIRVNCVSFQTNETPNSEQQTDAKEFELLRSKSVVAPNDVAGTTVYLLSSEAAAISGQVISVGAKRSKI